MKCPKKKITACGGFTIFEVLSTAVLFAVIVGITLVSFNMINSNWQIDADLVVLQQQVRQGMEKMSREIRQSRAVDVNVTNQGEDISFAIGGTPINYYVGTNGNLLRQDETGNTTIMANSISSASFTPPSDRKVRIRLSGAKTTLKKDLTFYLTEEVWLRN